MIAKASVYLDENGKPVPEGDKSARTLLVREGSEIPDAILNKYEGAAELAGSERKDEKKEDEKKAPPLVIPGTVEHREPVVEDRDPKHRKR